MELDYAVAFLVLGAAEFLVCLAELGDALVAHQGKMLRRFIIINIWLWTASNTACSYPPQAPYSWYPPLLTQLYLAFLVSFNSKTLYVIPNNRLATAVALFFSSFVPIVSSPQIYAGIFAYLYYDRYINISRREGVQRWLEERRERAQQTMQSQEMQVLNELSRRSVVTYK